MWDKCSEKRKEELNALREQLIAQSKDYWNSLPKKFEQARNPALAFGDYEFDPKATNFERFKNSPCYDKLGFDPIEAMSDSISLEREYQTCEKEYKMQELKKIGYFILTAIIMFLIVFLIYKKIKK